MKIRSTWPLLALLILFLGTAGCASAPLPSTISSTTGSAGPELAEGAGDAGPAGVSATPHPAAEAKTMAEAPSGQPPNQGAPSADQTTLDSKQTAQGLDAGSDTPQPTVKYLSADDSNSQASPVIVRRLIAQGHYVPPARVRSYEFLNYADFNYPAPEEELSLFANLGPGKVEGEYVLQVALRSKDKDWESQGTMNLTVLLDLSGSMAGAPLELAEAFVAGLAQKLRPQDRVSLLTVNRDVRIVFENRPAGPALADELRSGIFPILKANDISNLETGVLKAYETAERNYTARAVNRVIVVSDGAANAGTLAPSLIAQKAKDDDRQGIYLAGVAVGNGFNDYLMNVFTDQGRGAYLFLDESSEISKMLEPSRFLSNFDLALKNVRLKMVLPPGWTMGEFHGEQISDKAADVVPQYLAPNDQMIYHMTIHAPQGPIDPAAIFEWEAEYTPIGRAPAKKSLKGPVSDFLKQDRNWIKGSALVVFAEALKACRFPLEENRPSNLEVWDRAVALLNQARGLIPDDADLVSASRQMEAYRVVLESGEQPTMASDALNDDPAAVLGIASELLIGLKLQSAAPAAAAALTRLNRSGALVPQHGKKFYVLSTGVVGTSSPAGGSVLNTEAFFDPIPEFQGLKRVGEAGKTVMDLSQLTLSLKAPAGARSFSFDFNFFSAEYPHYIKQNFNDAFYAVLSAPSTNGGRPTNISFDPSGGSIEVDNNYFEAPFHPIPNAGTGFDLHGSTGWLRTSWPILGGEAFTITFSVHDEGDAAYDSAVILDNFRFHEFEAVGTTDPLN